VNVQDRIRDYWDRDARTYDHAPSHAASDPLEAAAWRAALAWALPPPPARVLDVGAGTGAISLLAAELGHQVTALDLSAQMLDRARAKADDRGLELSFVVGSSAEPPPGPFDAVMERHVLWTVPDPVGALRAWRAVVEPPGRLVLFEGVWGRRDLAARARDLLAEGLRRALRVPHDHHAPYDPAVLEELPLARLPSPVPLIDAVGTAGWRRPRVRRLADVEWARRELAPSRLLGRLEAIPQYALIADA
jgi:SAM-dependent methyltransferase